MKLCDAKLDQSANCQYLMDYYKTLCEFGKEFSDKELAAIYLNMKENNLLNDDALKCFLLIFAALGISVSSLQVSEDGKMFEELFMYYIKQQQALAMVS